MSQSPLAIPLWESALGSMQFSRIIELGTWWGNFSLYLYLFCVNRKAEFYTYDIVRMRGSQLKRKVGLDSCHRRKDIFENADEIVALIKKAGTTILFCDGGDKAREFRTFAPHLKKGDVIAVHDWMTEIFPKDINGFGLKELSLAVDDGMTKFFKYE